MRHVVRPRLLRAANCCWIVGPLLLAIAAGPAWGQARARQAAPKPVDPKVAAANQATDAKREQSRLRFKVNQVRGGGKIEAGDRATVDQYYGMFATLMTMPGFSSELPSLRESIKRETRTWGMASDKSGLAIVNGILLAKMQEVAFDDKQPLVARLNCMLVIGDLNAVETNLVGAGDPKAMPEAAPVLVAAISDPKAADAVKVTALVGLLRHAELGIEDKQVEKQVITELQTLAAASEVPDTRSAEGHHWMRRRAIEVLVTLLAKPNTPPNQEFATTLEQIVANQDLPLAFRAEAAEALGRVGVAEGTIVGALGETTLEITQAELSPRGYRYYLRAMQRCLTGVDAKSGVAPKLPLTEKKLAAELTDLLGDINTRMDRVGNDPQGIRNQMVLEAERVEEWLATFTMPDEPEKDDSTKPVPPEPAPTETKVEAKADAPAEAAPPQAASSGN